MDVSLQLSLRALLLHPLGVSILVLMDVSLQLEVVESALRKAAEFQSLF